jgi:hypothetical protein
MSQWIRTLESRSHRGQQSVGRHRLLEYHDQVEVPRTRERGRFATGRGSVDVEAGRVEHALGNAASTEVIVYDEDCRGKQGVSCAWHRAPFARVGVHRRETAGRLGSV